MGPGVGVLHVVVAGDVLGEVLLNLLVEGGPLLLGGVLCALVKQAHDLVVVVPALVGGGGAPGVGEGAGVGAPGAAGGAHIPLQVLVQILRTDGPLVLLDIQLDAHGVQVLGHQGGDVGGAEDGGGEAAVGQLEAVAVRAAGIAGVVQDLVGLVHVIAGVRHVPVDRPLHLGGVPVVAGIHVAQVEDIRDALVVNGPADGLAHPHVADIGAGRLLAHVELGPLDDVGALALHGDAVRRGQPVGLREGGRGRHPAGLAGLHGGHGGGLIGNEVIDHAVQVGAVAVVVLVGLQLAVAAQLGLNELERAGAHRGLVGGVGEGIRPLVDVGGQDVGTLIVADALHKGAAGVGHVEDHRVVVRGLHGVNHLHIAVGVCLVAVLQDAVKGPLDILGGEGLSVVPLDALPQVEGVGHQIVGDVPGLGQIRIDGLGVLVPGAELGEDVVADIDHAAVPLVVRLIEGGLKLGGDHQRSAVVVAVSHGGGGRGGGRGGGGVRRGGVAAVARRTAAGRQGDCHDERQ